MDKEVNVIPHIIPGGLAVDDRGSLTFVNDFNFKDVKRFYLVENHRSGFIRAFHGHVYEGKYVLVVSGAALVKCFPLENWQNLRTNDSRISTFVLSAERPQVLVIPPGYFNGFKTLREGTKVLFFSTSTLEESKEDDIRISAYPGGMSGIWDENFR